MPSVDFYFSIAKLINSSKLRNFSLHFFALPCLFCIFVPHKQETGATRQPLTNDVQGASDFHLKRI